MNFNNCGRAKETIENFLQETIWIITVPETARNVECSAAKEVWAPQPVVPSLEITGYIILYAVES